jgi:NAD(P)-dependent dehydrogenase (short-subunit alcohol dehydrogenase family)
MQVDDREHQAVTKSVVITLSLSSRGDQSDGFGGAQIMPRARQEVRERVPRVNMAKASLNMLTRTSAGDFAEKGIFMNSVDTGWVTDEDPHAHAMRKRHDDDFHPPLDAIDGAARVVDPIFTGYATGKHSFGRFFKDYLPTEW